MEHTEIDQQGSGLAQLRKADTRIGPPLQRAAHVQVHFGVVHACDELQHELPKLGM